MSYLTNCRDSIRMVKKQKMLSLAQNVVVYFVSVLRTPQPSISRMFIGFQLLVFMMDLETKMIICKCREVIHPLNVVILIEKE